MFNGTSIVKEYSQHAQRSRKGRQRKDRDGKALSEQGRQLPEKMQYDGEKMHYDGVPYYPLVILIRISL